MSDIKLKSFSLKGYKSIRELEGFSPGPINILIGPNGSGKSNFISFFWFLSRMLNSVGKLQEHIAYLGGAGDILHDGPDVTKSIEAHLEIENKQGFNEYSFSLGFAKPDKLIFREEKYRYSAKKFDEKRDSWTNCGSGHEEAKLPEKTNDTAAIISILLKKLIVYQFHNTSSTANMRLKWSQEDSRWLKQNGDNLGSFLYRIQNEEPLYYKRIVSYIRLVLPFFDEFDLYPDFGKVLLRWKEKESIKVFNAGQASDGMLRTIALISLLGQNPKDLPAVLFLDEPELGLHPSAIDLVAGLIKSASEHCQVFVATQSLSLVNNFELKDLVVIDRKGRASEYRRPDPLEFEAYLEEYTTGQLWEKNVIGGRP
ncbi:MAG: AAA family ATPase [Ignavibacteriaceae bacterium]|nr:AAA family ATPase [Ignavibacteriaceae bacterium]